MDDGGAALNREGRESESHNETQQTDFGQSNVVQCSPLHNHECLWRIGVCVYILCDTAARVVSRFWNLASFCWATAGERASDRLF